MNALSRKLKRTIGLLLTLILMISIAQNSIISAFASDTVSSPNVGKGSGSTAIADYMTSLSVQKKNGDTWTELSSGDTVTGGDELLLTLRWKIDGTSFAANRGSTYTYELPEGFAFTPPVSGNVYKGSSTTVAGSFTISGREVQITYLDTYNTNNDSTDNTLTLYGKASIVDGGDTEEIQFETHEDTVVIVVENPYDFTVEKTGSKLTQEMSDTSILSYEVTVDSPWGTQGTVNLTDTLSFIGENVFDSVSYVSDSFQVVNQDGEVMDLDGCLTLSEDGKSFVIQDLPKLNQNGSYTLTYQVKVVQTKGTLEEGSVANTVVVKSAGNEHNASYTITYPKRMSKSFLNYDALNERMQWEVQVNSANGDVKGYTFEDTAEAEITSAEDIIIMAYDSDGNETQVYPEITVSEDRKTFSFVFPQSADRWVITYYTKAVISEGEDRISVKNTARIIKTTDSDEVWEDSDIGVGNTVTISKESLGTTINVGQDTTITWKLNVTAGNLKQTSFAVEDRLKSAIETSTNTYYDDYHYTYATVLQEDFENNLTAVIEDSQGNEKTLTLADSQGYDITVSYYAHTDGKYTIEATDSTTLIRKFKIEISDGGQGAFSLKSLNISSYRTYFKPDDVKANQVWQIPNEATALIDGEKTVKANEYYKGESGSIRKQVGIPTNDTALIGEPPNVWGDGGAQVDYDLSNGKVYFRLLLKVTEQESTVTIRDVIPEGLTMSAPEDYYDDNGESKAADRFFVYVGPYDGRYIQYYRELGWTGDNRKANITVTAPTEDNGNTLTVTINNVNSILNLTDTNMIGIQYACDIEDWEVYSQFTGKSENGKAKESATWTNQAEYVGQGSTSAVVTVNRERSVLDKSGVQIQNEGSYTSTVHYSVTINEGAIDFLEDGDELTLTDTIRSTELSYVLKRDTIKLYQLESDGTKTEVAIGKITIGDQETDDSGVTAQTFTMPLADGTAYVLEYDYEVTGSSAGNRGTLSNGVELVGVASTDNSYTVKELNASARTDHGSLTIFKVDSENQTEFLEGAEFTLQKYAPDSDAFEDVESFSIESATEGKLYDYFSSHNILTEDTLYRLVETKAPKGYTIGEDTEPTYFVVRGWTGEAADLQIRSEEEALALATGGNTALDGVELDTIQDAIHLLAPDTSAQVYVLNEKSPSVELPGVGGIGTRVIKLLGFSLILFAMLLYTSKRKYLN